MVLEICNARDSPRQFNPRAAQFNSPPADLHLLCSRAPVRLGLQYVSLNSLQGVCMTMLGNWEIVGCYQNLATCRGRGRLDIHGNRSRSFLPKTAMQGESADNLRETMNSPSSFRTCTETGHSLFFLFCSCLWAACTWYGRARVQLPCCVDALWREAGDARSKDLRSSVLRAFPNLGELHWGPGGQCFENPQRAP